MIDWSQDHAEWIRQQIGVDDVHPRCWMTAAVLRDGKPAAAVILYNWTPDAVCFGAAASVPGAFTRCLMKAAVNRAFDFLQVKVALAHTQPDNLRAQRVLKRLGFVQTGVVMDALGAGQDLQGYTLEYDAAVRLLGRLGG